MEIRHNKLTQLFRDLSGKVEAYINKHAETCLEENENDPNGFYECVKSNSAPLNENLYKFENLSLYSDLREKECKESGEDYEQCIQTLFKDVKEAAKDLEENLE